MRFALPAIHHDRDGFAILARFHAEAENCFLDDIEIDMKATTWFDADMCAAFGAILYYLGTRLNSIHLVNINSDIERILSKNGFLSHYGRKKIPDNWGTTVAYQRFDAGDNRYFREYVENEFIHRSEIPKMSSGLLKKFRKNIYEIFDNAEVHSETQWGVFSCGQFFPKKNRLDFTVADLGVGMHRKVCDHIQGDLSPEQAISWATAEQNTTKVDNIPGGLGLKLLREFIDLNGGCIQIASDAGYWQRKNRKTNTSALPQRFPGTVVSVEINTADDSSYRLSSEVASNEIF